MSEESMMYPGKMLGQLAIALESLDGNMVMKLM